MNAVLMIVLLILMLISSAMGYYEIMTLKHKLIGEKERIKVYKGMVLEGLIMITFVIIAIIISDITVTDIGFKFLDMGLIGFNFWVKPGTYILCGILLILTLYQMIGYMVSKAFRQQLMQQIKKPQPNRSHYEEVISEIILPKTRKEKLWFTVVSATAGIGEEIVYRGFLFYLLMSLFPWLPLYGILIIAGILFGIAHSYQGLFGVLKTGLIGMLLGALYMTSGFLLPGILLHFILDFSSNFLLSEDKTIINEANVNNSKSTL
jgi:membrane protease YdiL (CAAX protease family)